MPPEVLISLIGGTALLLGTGGGAWLGHILSSREQKRAALITAEANKISAEHLLINQLQEEQPSDDLVSTFLIAASQQGGKQKLDHAAAVELANRIADPGKRAVTLSAIGDR